MQHYRQRLDTAVRLAAISNKPYGVAQTVLLYHEQLYHTLETFQGCNLCHPHIAVMKKTIEPLQVRCSYFQDHLAAFRQFELKQLMKETLAALDLSTCCESCRKQFQEQSMEALPEPIEDDLPLSV